MVVRGYARSIKGKVSVRTGFTGWGTGCCLVAFWVRHLPKPSPAVPPQPKRYMKVSLCHKAEILKLKQLNDMKFASAVGYGSGV